MKWVRSREKIESKLKLLRLFELAICTFDIVLLFRRALNCFSWFQKLLNKQTERAKKGSRQMQMADKNFIRLQSKPIRVTL